jgi:preprotein translocase subunit YajC
MNLLAFGMAVLAQAQGGNGANGGGGGGGSIWPLLLPLVVIAILFQLMISRPQKREQARRDEMLKALKKNDPVVTIGGIIGNVVSVSEDGSEVVVRVDDNTRLKLRRDAIREVIRKDEDVADAEKK